MNARSLFAAMLLFGSPVALAAQSGLAPGSLFASAGLGAGTATFTCDGCPSQQDAAGPSGLAQIGVAIRPTLALAAEVSGWRNHYESSLGASSARIVNVNLAVIWYPGAEEALFVKAGVGMASIRDDIAMHATGETTVATRGPAYVLGLGWELPLSRSFAAMPYVDVNYALAVHQTLNDVKVGQRLGGTLVHFGLGVTLR